MALMGGQGEPGKVAALDPWVERELARAAAGERAPGEIAERRYDRKPGRGEGGGRCVLRVDLPRGLLEVLLEEERARPGRHGEGPVEQALVERSERLDVGDPIAPEQCRQGGLTRHGGTVRPLYVLEAVVAVPFHPRFSAGGMRALIPTPADGRSGACRTSRQRGPAGLLRQWLQQFAPAEMRPQCLRH